MARIRSIHPGLFTDEAFMTLTVEEPIAIALLLGLWVEADDAGAFEWKPLTLKARIIPSVMIQIAPILAKLCETHLIRKFEFDGKPYGVIRNFAKYQRPKDPKDIHPFSEESRIYAGFNEDGTRPRSNLGPKQTASSSDVLPEDTGSAPEVGCQRKEEGGRKEEEGVKEESSLRSDSAPQAKKTSSRGSRLPEGWMPDDAGRAMASEALGNAGARLELDKFRDWAASASGAKGVKADWNATWRNWVRGAVERAPTRAGPAKPDPQEIKNPYLRAIKTLDEKYAAEERNRNAGAQPIERGFADPEGGTVSGGRGPVLAIATSR